MNNNRLFIMVVCLCMALTACNQQKVSETNNKEMKMENWKKVLEEKLPLLGHRNWIVVTDMAYPLQSHDGITTVFAQEDYGQVVRQVSEMIKSAPHVFAHTYLDKEQEKLSEDLVKGWDAYRDQLGKALNLNEVQYLPHEDLIRKLDEVSSLFEVVIIKTPLTIPYTTAFFELDCQYWDAEREATLRK